MRYLLPTIVLFVLVTLTSSQLTKAQLAELPITSPITGPITSPITNTPTPTNTPTLTATPTVTSTPTVTITPPPDHDEESLISGKVSYTSFFRFFPGHWKKPAKDVEVEAINRKTGDVFSDTTDSNGIYEIPVTEGLYFVHPVDDDAFFFPWIRTVRLRDGQEKDNLNFTGYIFHFR